MQRSRPSKPTSTTWWPDLVWWMRGLQLVKEDSEPGPKCMGMHFQGTCIWQPRRLFHWIDAELHRGKWHINYFVLKHNDWFMLVKQKNNRMKARTVFFLMLPVVFLWQSCISSEKFNFNTVSQIKIPDIPHTLAEIPFPCSSSSACLQSLHVFCIPHFSWIRLYCTNADQIMLCHSTVTSTNWTALF